MSRARYKVVIDGTWGRKATYPHDVTSFRRDIPLTVAHSGGELTVKVKRPAIKVAHSRVPQFREGTFRYTTEVFGKDRWERYSGGVAVDKVLAQRALNQLQELCRDITCYPPTLKVTKLVARTYA